MEEYENDKRIACQYGKDCYQKNPAHHSKYKHPPKETKEEDIIEPGAKKRKLNSPDNTHKNIETKPESPKKTTTEIVDYKTFIKDHFLIEMPQDFYDFWDFCKELNPDKPTEALKQAGLVLVGTYDVLSGSFTNVKKSPEEYLRHWRYYYDPPEVQTILKGDDTTGYHIGYFYDSAKEPPAFLVSNCGEKDGTFVKMGDNIFAAVNSYLDEMKSRSDPFKKVSYVKLQNSLKRKAEELGLNISPHSEKIKKRDKKIVTKTWNKIGLVVPYDKKTELGYRDLAMGDKELRTLLTKIQEAAPEQKARYLSELQPVLTFASIALDECDFGTGLKLGWNLIAHGIDSLNSTILRFLTNSYKLLQREEFAKIAESHLADRKRGTNLSILN